MFVWPGVFTVMELLQTVPDPSVLL